MTYRAGIMARDLAWARGERFYVRGKPCKRCGRDEWYTSCRTCTECHRQDYYKRHPHPRALVSTSEARAAREMRSRARDGGLRTYQRGIPCYKCGTDEYSTAGGRCLECDRRSKRAERRFEPCAVCSKPFAVWSGKLTCSRECGRALQFWGDYLRGKVKRPRTRKEPAPPQQRQCIVCGGWFIKFRTRLVCSEECRKINYKQWSAHWRAKNHDYYKLWGAENRESRTRSTRLYRFLHPEMEKERRRRRRTREVAARKFVVEELGIRLGKRPNQGTACLQFLRQLGINLTKEKDHV